MDTTHAQDGKLNRRGFLKLGLASSVSLMAISTGAGLSGCSSDQAASGYQFLRDDDLLLFTAVVPAILLDANFQQDTTNNVISGIDNTLMAVPQTAQVELRQLFDLLNWRLSRGASTGIWATWPDASADDVQSFLTDWQLSSVELFNAGYRALSKLTQANYYALPESQTVSGYPGPQGWARKGLA